MSMKNLSIGKRILAGFAVVVAVMLMAVLITGFELRKVSKAASGLRQRSLVLASHATEAELATVQV